MVGETSRPILTMSSSLPGEERNQTELPSSHQHEPPQEGSGIQESLALLQQIEWTALALGAVFSAGAWLIPLPFSARIAVLVGAVFSSVNFRLLIWSWSWIFRSTNPQSTAEHKTNSRVVPRFLIKYLFLLAGLALLIGGLKLHVIGFMVGMGNVLFAVALSPAMMLSSRSSS